MDEISALKPLPLPFLRGPSDNPRTLRKGVNVLPPKNTNEQNKKSARQTHECSL